MQITYQVPEKENSAKLEYYIYNNCITKRDYIDIEGHNSQEEQPKNIRHTDIFSSTQIYVATYVAATKIHHGGQRFPQRRSVTTSTRHPQ
jgi:hypothetical protein